MDPNAMLDRALTADDLLSSQILSSPLRAKESNVLADGGSAFIATSGERAAELADTPVYLLGKGFPGH